MEKGLIHIYCGDGKGKTTAATGLAVRAAGAGKRVLIARFLKTNHSGELVSLKVIPGITVLPLEKEFGFLKRADSAVKQSASEYYIGYFRDAVKRAADEDYDLLIMDEIMATVNLGLLDMEELLTFLKNKPDKLEVVLTGRDPDKRICELADYISDIRKIKHPFDKGTAAREGIEY